MVSLTNHTILVIVASLILKVLLSKGMAAQEVHEGMDMQTSTIQKRENTKGNILFR
jgi:hypothetical protein